MSKTTTTKTAVRSAAEIEIEIAEALARRKEMNRTLTTLRAEHRAAVAAEERARAEEIGSKFLAAAGDREALARLVAEVAEVAAEPSGAAPPAPEDADDGGDADQREPHHEQRGWGGEHG